MKILTRTKTG